MAAVQSTDSLRDMVECCICADEFTDARMLPCIHTFCFACLETIGKDKQPGEMMPCPLCRSEFKIPVAGLKGIQKNFFMQRLVEVQRLTTVDSTNALCDACLEDDSVEKASRSIASVICIECNQKLCQLCHQYHNRYKLNKEHQVVDLKNKEEINKLTKSLAQSFCDRHKNERIKMYCYDCKSPNCLVCQFESHQGHKCSDIEKVGQDFSQQLSAVITKMTNCINSNQKKLDMFDTKNQSMLGQTKSLQMDVKRQAEMIKNIVDEHANLLFSEIDSIKACQLKEIENEREEVSTLSMMLESLQRYSTEIKEKGSVVDICRNFQEMISRSDELERNHIALMESGWNFTDDTKFFTFYPSDFENFRKNSGNVIGIIKSHVNPWQTKQTTKLNLLNIDDNAESEPEITACKNFSCSKDEISSVDLEETEPAKIGQIKCRSYQDIQEVDQFVIKGEENNGISGLTVLKDKIYVLCSGAKSVRVFPNQKPFREFSKEKIVLKDMVDPFDMAASDITCSVYISDSGKECIWEIQMPYKKVIMREVDGQPRGLSITPFNELLSLTLCDNGWFTVDFYNLSTNGRHIRRIDLPSGIEDVCHAVQMSDEAIVLSYLYKGYGDMVFVSKVSKIMSREGITLAQRNPVYLSIDDNDNVFVADSKGDQIFLLNSQLKDTQILLDRVRHNIDQPWRLCYLPDKQQLIIGQGWPASISVVKFQNI